MSLFEFLMVLVSLIIGLGIAELLSGVAKTIRHRQTLKPYWIHSTFVLIIFLALLQQWWEIWSIRDTPVWTFPGLVMMLAGPIGLFLLAHLVFPENIEGEDIRTFYFEKMGPTLWIAVATVLVSVLFRPLIIGSELLVVDNLSSLLLMIIFTAMAKIKNPIFHSCMVILVLVGLLADILYVGMAIQ